MAIHGLRPAPEALATPESPLYRVGTVVNPAAEAEVAVEAFKLLGVLGDKDETLESTTDNFTQVAAVGYAGRLFVELPKEVVSTDALFAAAEAARPDGVEAMWRWPNLWAPGTEAESYSVDDLNQAPAAPVARLALFNLDERTGVDPILQHLSLPFDQYAKERWGGKRTQREAVAEDVETFETGHPDYTLQGIDHRGFAFMALMDRIKGVSRQDLILSRGFMRMQELERRSVGGDSIVGRVSSVDGQLYLGGSRGGARVGGGVGVSAGLTEA